MCVYKYFRYQIILCFYVKYIFYVSRHFFSFLCSCFYRYIHAIKFFFTSDFTRNVRFSHFFFVSQLSIFSPKLDRGSLTLWKQIWVFTFQPRETKEREREISPTTRLKYLEIQKLAGIAHENARTHAENQRANLLQLPRLRKRNSGAGTAKFSRVLNGQSLAILRAAENSFRLRSNAGSSAMLCLSNQLDLKDRRNEQWTRERVFGKKNVRVSEVVGQKRNFPTD